MLLPDRAPTRAAHLLFALLAPLLGACAGNAPTYDVDYAHDTDFSRYQTYRWLDDDHPSEMAEYRAYNSSDQRVRTYVERELKQKGLREAPQGAADLWVDYHISKQHQMRVDSIAGYPSGGFYGGAGVGTYGSGISLGYSSGPSVREYDEGTVVLDIIDTRSGKIVWRGIAEGRLKDGLSIKDKNHIASEVSRVLLAEYPPEPGAP